MPTEYRGDPQAATQRRYGIVVARYNETITGKLLQGAVDAFQERGVMSQQLDVVWVPGAWELPVAAAAAADSGRYAALVCLGCVIRGETTHDQHINRQVSLGLGEIARQHRLPVLFGVLTCQTLEQALQRAGGREGNKGAECAEAALEMADLLQKLPAGGDLHKV